VRCTGVRCAHARHNPQIDHGDAPGDHHRQHRPGTARAEASGRAVGSGRSRVGRSPPLFVTPDEPDHMIIGYRHPPLCTHDHGCVIHLWFPLSARPPPALCPQSHVLWARSLVSEDSARLLDSLLSFRSIHSSQLPINAQRSRTKFGFRRPLRFTLRIRIGHARLGPDWGQIGASLGLARFGFGRPPRQQAWVAAQ
jgi:hypothetical protein